MSHKGVLVGEQPPLLLPGGSKNDLSEGNDMSSRRGEEEKRRRVGNHPVELDAHATPPHSHKVDCTVAQTVRFQRYMIFRGKFLYCQHFARPSQASQRSFTRAFDETTLGRSYNQY